MSEREVVIDMGEAGVLRADEEWRVPGGRVVHQAGAVDYRDGQAVVLVCDTKTIHYYAEDSIGRLNLRQHGEDVTCKTCRRTRERVLRTPTDSEGDDGDE